MHTDNILIAFKFAKYKIEIQIFENNEENFFHWPPKKLKQNCSFSRNWKSNWFQHFGCFRTNLKKNQTEQTFSKISRNWKLSATIFDLTNGCDRISLCCGSPGFFSFPIRKNFVCFTIFFFFVCWKVTLLVELNEFYDFQWKTHAIRFNFLIVIIGKNRSKNFKTHSWDFFRRSSIWESFLWFCELSSFLFHFNFWPKKQKKNIQKWSDISYYFPWWHLSL